MSGLAKHLRGAPMGSSDCSEKPIEDLGALDIGHDVTCRAVFGHVSRLAFEPARHRDHESARRSTQLLLETTDRSPAAALRLTD